MYYVDATPHQHAGFALPSLGLRNVFPGKALNVSPPLTSNDLNGRGGVLATNLWQGPHTVIPSLPLTTNDLNGRGGVPVPVTTCVRSIVAATNGTTHHPGCPISTLVESDGFNPSSP